MAPASSRSLPDPHPNAPAAAFALVLCCALGAGCEASSSGPTQLAQVILITGQPRIGPTDKLVAATEGALIAASDRIVTGPGDALVVATHNGHVQRIESDVDMAASEIAALELDPTTRPFDAQLAELMSPEQRDALLQGRSVKERVAGFSQRLTAASTAAPVLDTAEPASAAQNAPTSEVAMPKAVEEAEADTVPQPAPAEAKKETARQAADPEQVKQHQARDMPRPDALKRPEASGPRGVALGEGGKGVVKKVGEKLGKAKDATPRAPVLKKAKGKRVAPGRMSAATSTMTLAEAEAAARRALTKCVDAWAAAKQGPARAGKPIQVVLRLDREGTVRAVQMKSGQRAPKCIQRWFRSVRIKGERPGRAIVTLRKGK